MTEPVAPDGPLAFLCHPYHRGGVTQWMIEAAVEWSRRGNPCWFVVPRPTRPFLSGAGRPPMLDLLEPAAAASGFAIVAQPAGRGFELGSRRWRAYEHAAALVGGVPAGVPVIVSDDEPVWRAGAWCSRRNPLIGVLHSDDPYYYGLAAEYSKEASALIAVSQRIKDHVARIAGVEGGKVLVIPCGVPLGPPPVHRHGSARLRLVWIGRIEEVQKRASDIATIAARLSDDGLDFTMDVIGDGPARAELEQAVARQGLRDRVRMAGWSSPAEIRRALDQADVLLSTSNFEGMPVVIMEALAAGCGVVASRVSGVEDYDARPEATGCLWTYTTGSVKEAASAIGSVAALPRDQVARRARALAEAEFSIQRCMERYATMLRRLGPAGAAEPRLWPHRVAAAASPVLAFARSVRAGLHPSVRLR